MFSLVQNSLCNSVIPDIFIFHSEGDDIVKVWTTDLILNIQANFSKLVCFFTFYYFLEFLTFFQDSYEAKNDFIILTRLELEWIVCKNILQNS